MNEELLLSLPSLLVKKDTTQLLNHNGKKYETRLDFNDIFSHVVILSEMPIRKFLLQNDFYSLLVISLEDNYEVRRFEQLPYYNKIEDDLFYFSSFQTSVINVVRFIENKFKIIMKIKIPNLIYDAFTILYAKKRYILVLHLQSIIIYDLVEKKHVKSINSHSHITSLGGKLGNVNEEEIFISGYGQSKITIWKLDDKLNIQVITSIPIESDEIPNLSISDNMFFLSPYLYIYNKKTDKYVKEDKKLDGDFSFSAHNNILFSKTKLVLPQDSKDSQVSRFTFHFQSDQKIIDVFSKDIIITQIESTGIFSVPEIRINVYNTKDKTYQVNNTIKARELLISFPMSEKEKRKIFSEYFANVNLSKNLINVIVKFI